MPPLDSSELEVPYRQWELSLGPLEEQPVLLTTESSLQPENGLKLRQKLIVKAMDTNQINLYERRGRKDN